MAVPILALAVVTSTSALTDTASISLSEPGAPKGVEAPAPAVNTPPPPPPHWDSLPFFTTGFNMEVGFYAPREIQRALGATTQPILPIFGLGVNVELRPIRWITILPSATLLL